MALDKRPRILSNRSSSIPGRMSAFPKAAVQNGRVGVDLNVCLWPKADIR